MCFIILRDMSNTSVLHFVRERNDDRWASPLAAARQIPHDFLSSWLTGSPALKTLSHPRMGSAVWRSVAPPGARKSINRKTSKTRQYKCVYRLTSCDQLLSILLPSDKLIMSASFMLLYNMNKL